MSGNGYSYFCAQTLGKLIGNLIGDCRIGISLHELFQFFLGHCRTLLRDSTFCHCKNGKALLLLIPSINGVANAVNAIGNLRNQNNVRSACNSCMKGKLAHLMSHNLHNENTSMRCRCGMNTINTVCCNIYRTLETESHIGCPDIVIDGLRHMQHIQPFFS